MPFLNQQIQLINDCLRQTAFADARFGGGRFETIAVDVNRKKDNSEAIETFPAIMDANYEARAVTVDDTYPIVIYHKLLNKLYAFDKAPGGYGDKQRYITETTQVKMVVYGKYAAIKLTREQLEALITANFPDNINPAALQPYKLDEMMVTLRSTALNAASVWQEEYKGIPLYLAPEDIFFAVRYDIDTRYRKGCFAICDCEL